MEDPTVVTYNIMIGIYYKNKKFYEIEELLRRMTRERIAMNSSTYAILIAVSKVRL